MQAAQPGGDAGLDWGVQSSSGGRRGPWLVHVGSDGTWLTIVVLRPGNGSGVLVAANAGPDMGGETAAKAALKAAVAHIAPLAAAQGPARAASH